VLRELEEEVMAQTTRVAVKDAINYMNELKNLTNHYRSKIEGKMEKQMAAMEGRSDRSYRDIVWMGIRHHPIPTGGYWQEKASRVGNFYCFPMGLGMHQPSQADVLKKFNGAFVEAGGNSATHKIRSVERLGNQGLLGEFLTEEGAKWFIQQSAFITALSEG
jgi:hypothetical protein